VPAQPNILVIGGGISGLACAFRLRALQLPVLLVERGARFGGVIDTVEKDGFRFDIGPQSFLSTAALDSLIAELGLTGQLLRAPHAAPRYILHRGRLVPAPLGPAALLRTPLIGWRTKLRLLSEPFRTTHPPEADESVAAFVRRKFGEDLLANLVAPFISGVYAGDPEWLSLASAFPPLRRLEAEHGSVIRGALKSGRKGRQTRASLCNFPAGLVTLTRALAERIGQCARSGAEVAMIRRGAAGEPAGFNVALSRGGAIEPLRVSAIVMAAPAEPAARLLAGIEPRFADALGHIDYAPVAQASAGYRLADIAEPKLRSRSGFGFLVPRGEGLRSLGTVWNSFLFSGRAPDAPEKMASFTTFLGGAADTDIRQCGEKEIAATAHGELAGVLGIRGAPVVQQVTRWDRALPQYNLGHGGIVQSLADLCAGVPGLFLAGNYLAGPSLGACIEQANTVAERAAAFCRREETADPSLRSG
jgi:protoporphyrinogen/coproporphyrinogen III oxidase